MRARSSRTLVTGLEEQGYLQEWFGYHCIDANEVAGKAGRNPGAYALRKTFRDDMWPVDRHAPGWDEAALLTAVEFYNDHVSKGKTGRYHS